MGNKIVTTKYLPSMTMNGPSMAIDGGNGYAMVIDGLRWSLSTGDKSDLKVLRLLWMDAKHLVQ